MLVLPISCESFSPFLSPNYRSKALANNLNRSQLIWHYSETGLVEVPTAPAASFLWPAFNLHHSLPSNGEPVEPVATRVLPAAFPRTYVRADIPGVPVGTLAPVTKRSPKAGRGGRRV